MNRQIGVDFGTTTSVLAYRDFEKQNEGPENLVKFDGRDYVPTMVLQEGSITNKKGMEIRHEECFGWDAAKATSFHSLLKRDFKMGLISNNAAVRDEAKVLTEKFFRYMYERYTAGAITQKGTQFEKISTVVTYPGKFPEEVQQILKKAAEAAGFPNVTLVDESKAAMKFALSYDTEDTKQFFRKRQGRKLKVMIIDMGAGTTDISVFEYDTADPSNFVHLCSWPEKGGNNFGGSEIDGILCDFYKEKMGDNIVRILGTGNAELGEKLLRNKVKEFKEQTISDVLGRNEDVMDLPGDLVPIKYSMPEEPDTDLDRAAFEELLKDYLPQFPDLVHGALNKAGLGSKDVDLVLLTGGHSQWYFVKEMLVKAGISGGSILSFPEPHLVVARGAAWYVEPEKKVPVPDESVIKLITEEGEIAVMYVDSQSENRKAFVPVGSLVSRQHIVPLQSFYTVIQGKGTEANRLRIGCDGRESVLSFANDRIAKEWLLKLRPGNMKELGLSDSSGLGDNKDTPVQESGRNPDPKQKSEENVFPLKYDPRSLIRPVIATNSASILAVTSKGTVLGITDMKSTTKGIDKWHNIVAVALCTYFSVGLRSNGTVVTNSTDDWSKPTQNWTNIVSIAAGAEFIAGLRSDGTVVAVARKGILSWADEIYSCRTWKNVKYISATDGGRGCPDMIWGMKTSGECMNSEAYRGSYPYARIIKGCQSEKPIILTADRKVICHLSDCYQKWENIVAVDGDEHLVGLKSDGTVVAVGLDIYNRLNVSNWRNIIAVAASCYWTIGLKNDGTLCIAYKKQLFSPKSPEEEIRKWKLF